MKSNIIYIENMNAARLEALIKKAVHEGIYHSNKTLIISIDRLPKKINREVYLALTGYSIKTFLNHIKLGYLKSTLRKTKTGRIMYDISKDDFISYYFKHVIYGK